MATDQAQRRRALWFEPACVASREGDGGVVEEANVEEMGCTRKASPPCEPQGVVNTALRMQIQALGLVTPWAGGSATGRCASRRSLYVPVQR